MREEVEAVGEIKRKSLGVFSACWSERDSYLRVKTNSIVGPGMGVG